VASHAEEWNLSRWGALETREQAHKLDELIELVEEGEMPLPSYTWGHPEARLTPEERQTLIAWARTAMDDLEAGAGEPARPSTAEP